MTPEEWVEIVDWVADRYPRGWRAEQAVAFYDDLHDYDAADVWTGLFAIYGEGGAYLPTGSQLVAATRDARRAAAIEDRYQRAALPVPEQDVKGVDGWLATIYPDEAVTGEEHIRRVHRKRGPCGSRFCDIHSQPEENTCQSQSPTNGS